MNRLNNNRIIPVFVPHRGCPNDCVFCNQKKITGKTNIQVNSNYVESIVNDYLNTRDHYNELAFFGGSFTAIDIELQTELLETAYKYLKAGAFDNIRISTRPDCITPEILELQKKYGVRIIELGIQSLDDEVLKKSNRGHTAKHCREASSLIRKYGFILGHQIMPGLPGSDFQKDILTCQKSIEMHPDIVRIYPTLTIKDTELECMLNSKSYTPLTIDEAVDLSAYIYSLYTINDINVIRIGLQNTDTINEENDVIAGPFHPAFRQLVEDKILLCSMENLLKNVNVPDYLTIMANKRLMNYINGQSKHNFNYLKSRFGIKRIYLKEIEDTERIFFYDNYKSVGTIALKNIYDNYVKFNEL